MSAASLASAGQHDQTEIIVHDWRWHRLIRRAPAVAARAARVGGGGVVVLASDREVRRLNARDGGRTWGRNKPTNVLTYEPPAPGLPGQIIVALGTVRREAAAMHRRPAHHLAHLVVHGMLHLAGEDHHHPGDARRMEMRESLLLHRLRVPNPWKRG